MLLDRRTSYLILKRDLEVLFLNCVLITLVDNNNSVLRYKLFPTLMLNIKILVNLVALKKNMENVCDFQIFSYEDQC